MPVQVGTDTNWMTIDTKQGAGYACGLRTDHTWWCAVPPSTIFQRAQGSDWIAAGPRCGIRTNGTLFCVGDLAGTDTDWATISFLSTEACGTRTSGILTCKGTGAAGELGNGDAWALVPTPVVTP